MLTSIINLVNNSQITYSFRITIEVFYNLFHIFYCLLAYNGPTYDNYKLQNNVIIVVVKIVIYVETFALLLYFVL